MTPSKHFLFFFCFLATSVNAVDLSSMTGGLFTSKTTVIDGQIRNAEFEFNVGTAILSDENLRENTHIIVSRNQNSVLIAGQAATDELKNDVQRLVLEVARLKWQQGDVNQVEPSNAQVCGDSAPKAAANNRRRFNLQQSADCSTVNRFYNEVRVSLPVSAIKQSDDELLRATIVNQLLHAGVVKTAETIKVVVSDNTVYLLGDELSETTAQHATVFVNELSGVEKVVPLFRF